MATAVVVGAAGTVRADELGVVAMATGFGAEAAVGHAVAGAPAKVEFEMAELGLVELGLAELARVAVDSATPQVAPFPHYPVLN
jgi:hypothetical protein